MTEWKIKRFEELSLPELYSLLSLRSEVFVVEQNCIYQDIDGKDPKALHLFCVGAGGVIAYCRLFPAGDYFEEASIGRVVVCPKHRQQNLGHELIRRAIGAISLHFGESRITISAQKYLRRFYESHGFEVSGAEYLEDGIPHFRMMRR